MKDVKLFAAQSQHLDRIQLQLDDLRKRITYKLIKCNDWNIFIENHLVGTELEKAIKNPSWYKHVTNINFMFPDALSISKTNVVYDDIVFNILFDVTVPFENAAPENVKSAEIVLASSFGVRTLTTIRINVDELDNFINTNFKE